jgi:hypothetical protein
MKPSMATYGWPGELSTLIVIVCRPPPLNVRVKSTARATKERFHMLTLATARPSTTTSARPRVGPSGPTHFTDLPVNVKVALAPGVVDQATLPPR